MNRPDPPPSASERLLTPPQVAARLQVNERTVTQWLRKGHLRGFKIGKEWRVALDDLEAFLNASANVPGKRTATPR
ncbi:MAG TPA: helix-turn-helix domain-containing protein [Kiloniellales bacterium]|nr:helix-turn-helix domain-containing protein [Kiloniellales bacterium]